jgi:hypothetical protein
VTVSDVAADPKPGEGHISQILYLFDLGAKVRKAAENGCPPGPDALTMLEGATALDIQDARGELDSGIAEGEKCIEVASVKGVIRPVQSLDVLLRHRPRSISFWP